MCGDVALMAGSLIWVLRPERWRYVECQECGRFRQAKVLEVCIQDDASEKFLSW